MDQDCGDDDQHHNHYASANTGVYKATDFRLYRMKSCWEVKHVQDWLGIGVVFCLAPFFLRFLWEKQQRVDDSTRVCCKWFNESISGIWEDPGTKLFFNAKGLFRQKMKQWNKWWVRYLNDILGKKIFCKKLWDGHPPLTSLTPIYINV